MNTVGALLLSVGLAWLIVAACSKPRKSWFSAFIVRGKNGRTGITLMPMRKKRRRRK